MAPRSDAPKPGDSARPSRPTHDSNMGVGEGNFQDVFGQHRHDGTLASGGLLYGPYLINDAAGKTWKLVVSTTGVLGVVKVH